MIDLYLLRTELSLVVFSHKVPPHGKNQHNLIEHAKR